MLCDLGYSAMDIITTLFRVVRSFKAEEFMKLEYIKVLHVCTLRARNSAWPVDFLLCLHLWVLQ